MSCCQGVLYGRYGDSHVSCLMREASHAASLLCVPTQALFRDTTPLSDRLPDPAFTPSPWLGHNTAPAVRTYQQPVTAVVNPPPNHPDLYSGTQTMEAAMRHQGESLLRPSSYRTDDRQPAAHSIGAVPGLPTASRDAFAEEEAHIRDRMERRKTQYRCPWRPGPLLALPMMAACEPCCIRSSTSSIVGARLPQCQMFLEAVLRSVLPESVLRMLSVELCGRGCAALISPSGTPWTVRCPPQTHAATGLDRSNALRRDELMEQMEAQRAVKRRTLEDRREDEYAVAGTDTLGAAKLQQPDVRGAEVLTCSRASVTATCRAVLHAIDRANRPHRCRRNMCRIPGVQGTSGQLRTGPCRPVSV